LQTNGQNQNSSCLLHLYKENWVIINKNSPLGYYLILCFVFLTSNIIQFQFFFLISHRNQLLVLSSACLSLHRFLIHSFFYQENYGSRGGLTFCIPQVLFDRLASHDLLNFARREGLRKKIDKWRKILKRIQAVLDDAD
jgi:hypothetical protein